MATKNSTPARQGAQLKTPKGTRDWVGRDLLLRDDIFKTISDVLERHGGIPLDTPVFELRDILSEKYGEDSRLIYDLKDQGGEACSLRYDLTVPFARWLAMRTDVQHIKRYQIAKVYRRDQPAISRGRLREFYQCDFDIAGIYDPMIPDAEILRIIAEVFEAFEMGITIKLNHRNVLDGLFAVAGVPSDKIRPTSSAVDKLDKSPWDEVRAEMLEKGLSAEIADRVGGFVQRSGGMREMLDNLGSDAELSANESVVKGVADMKLLASYLEAMGVIDKVSFDLSLARGLDYYTGLIYEVIPEQADEPTKVGSIAAGGRYDGLVGMYGRRPLPCVGISFGVDRIFTLLDARRKKSRGSELAREADVYVMAFGGKEFEGLLLERMGVASQLWAAGIRAEFSAKVRPKPQQQFNASEGAPVAVILGQDEVEAGQVRVKRLHENAGQRDKGLLVPRENLVEEVKKLLASITLDQNWTEA
ncbi:Histidine--tRNA ligase, mitochondrial [Neonectria ditissima]|uniref:histidine--tRNA ligase n=1 Tax=Neonectria ditissima TaxID=78410 RepID=A0A0P7BDU5_9HYPO|nr:Histidine--tRNA ligase, mitochondrial [Neonectria ditissima]